MKYLTDYRDPALANKLVMAIRSISTRPWRIMEVCGGQTHSIVKYGIDQLLEGRVKLLHGPGCPVCVTPLEAIDMALVIARQPGVIFCSFGDMLRVPGSQYDLLSIKAIGADVRVVYSPMDALTLAQAHLDREVVFFAVGFETTAPATALAVCRAKQLRIMNFSLLCRHVRVPPVMRALLSSPTHRIQGFLGAGHVCSIMGDREYRPLSEDFQMPIVITGFEPLDLLHGLYLCIKQLEEGRHVVENQYSRVVRKDGNLPAQTLMNSVFITVDRNWRGLGTIADSGLALHEDYSSWNAELKFPVTGIETKDSGVCRSGDVLQGLIEPPECPAFGRTCTPEHPLGATMVSSEGACAAYFRYRRRSGHVRA